MSEHCRYCDLPITPGTEVKTFGYWNVRPFPDGDGKTGNPMHFCHAECKDAGVKAEALECQTIDADCNDCRHFKRGRLVGKDVFDGFCGKFNQPTIAQPNKWTGHQCFEHRRP